MPSTAPQFSSHQKLLPRQHPKWSNKHQPQQKPRNMPSFWTKDPPTQQRNLAHSSAKWCPTLLVCCLTKFKKGNEGWNSFGYCNFGWVQGSETICELVDTFLPISPRIDPINLTGTVDQQGNINKVTSIGAAQVAQQQQQQQPQQQQQQQTVQQTQAQQTVQQVSWSYSHWYFVTFIKYLFL